MKKTIKKVLCLVLALVMFVSVLGICAFADKSVKQYKNYLCLGDSVASGYGLPSYEAVVDPYKGQYLREDVVYSGSYAQIVGNAVGAKSIESRAHSGWRAYDYLDMMGYTNLLGEDSFGTTVGKDFFISGMGWLGNRNHPSLVGSGQRIIDSIKKANLITLNLGCNDIFSYAQGVTMSTASHMLGWKTIYSIPTTVDGISNTFVSLLKTASKGEMKELVSTYISALMSGAKMYEEYMPKLVNVIKQLNPNATLVLVGLANPVCVNFPVDLKDLGINLYTHFDYYCTKENTFLKKLADDTGCLFADVSGTDVYGIKYLDATGVLTGDMLGVEVSGIKMVHPTPDGHAYMANKILQCLPGYDGEISTLPFLDVPDNIWYYDQLDYCYNNGITTGTSPTTFSPSSHVTRAQLVTFLYRIAKEPPVAGQYISFVDVPANEYYYNAIVWAQNAGIANGYSASTFAPNNIVTRAEAVSMLCRFAGATSSSNSFSRFTDASSIPTYACGAVSWAVDNNIVNGYPDGTFRPGNPLSRAEMVSILSNYCRNFT